MENDRRRGANPIPENFGHLLTENQKKSLPDLKKKGLSVFAVRRRLFHSPVIIMKLLAKNRYGILREDGMVDYYPDENLREQPSPQLEHFFRNAHEKNG